MSAVLFGEGHRGHACAPAQQYKVASIRMLN
jgi:hypothetical protein